LILRPPSPSLVVDADIILSVAFGLRARPVFERVLAHRAVLTSARAREEALGRAGGQPDGSEQAVALVLAALSMVTVIESEVCASLVEVAGERLKCAAASRNDSAREAHLLALAWITDSDLWTYDRDFAGTGWPTWSSHNLMAVLTNTASNCRLPA
jgi:predicted nucleic acid-binding protein